MAKPNVNWYGETVKAQVRRGNKKLLLAVAFQIEGQAKVNITNNGQVDTGFMRNSVYTTGAEQSNYVQANQSGQYTSQKSGADVDRSLAPELNPSNDDVYVVVGADYAIDQETKNSFLYLALEQTAGNNADVAIQRAVRG